MARRRIQKKKAAFRKKPKTWPVIFRFSYRNSLSTLCTCEREGDVYRVDMYCGPKTLQPSIATQYRPNFRLPAWVVWPNVVNLGNASRTRVHASKLVTHDASSSCQARTGYARCFIKNETLFSFFHNSLKWRSIHTKFFTVVAEEILIQNLSTKHGC